MPIELVSEPEIETPEEDQPYLTESGRVTLEGEVLASFLNSIDFSPLFEDPDVRPFVTSEVLPVFEDDYGRLVPVTELDEVTCSCGGKMKDGKCAKCGKAMESTDEGTMAPRQEKKPVMTKIKSPGTKPIRKEDCEGEMEFESIPGEIAAEFIDEADLSAMLEYYLKYEHPNDTLEDRTALGCFADVLAEDEPLEEKWKAPFKKGDFRKGPMQGISAKSKGVGKKIYGQRVRMMVAMLRKGVITRQGVKPGTGYKGGDYKRGPGYPKGTTSGQKSYAMASQKSHRNPGNISKYVDPGRRKVVQLIYKNIGASMPKNWVPPEKRHGGVAKTVKKITVKKDKGQAVSKGKAIFTGKGKAMDLSHVASATYTLHEGAGLAGAVGAVAMRQQKLNTPTRLLEAV